MSNRMPSLLALLGIAAVAGYQNRDKIKDFVGGAINDGQTRNDIRQDTGTGLPHQQDSGVVENLQSGIAELLQRFAGHGDEATPKSWVGTGQNQAVTPDWLGTVLGDDVIAGLSEKTGLTRVNLLSRLAQVLPDTVNELTPDGTIRIEEPAAQPGRPADFQGSPTSR